MFLSRIVLDTDRRDTVRALASPQYFHGAIEQSFTKYGMRNLWRIDWLDDRCCLLVLSAEEPDFTGLVEQFGFVNTSKWETKEYSPLLSRISAGQVWSFRLRANPVHSIKSSTLDQDKSGRGKVLAHVTTHQQKLWLLQRSETNGFSLQENGFDVVHTEWLRFRKRSGSDVVLRTATFEGLITVTEPQAFKNCLLSGIGRAKAYGCGLLTVASPGGVLNA